MAEVDGLSVQMRDQSAAQVTTLTIFLTGMVRRSAGRRRLHQSELTCACPCVRRRGYAGQKSETAVQNAEGPTIEIARRPARRHKRLRCHRQAPGGRAYLRVPGTMSSFGQGPGSNHSLTRGMAARRLPPTHIQAHRKGLKTLSINFAADFKVVDNALTNRVGP